MRTICGCLPSSDTLILSSRIFRNLVYISYKRWLKMPGQMNEYALINGFQDACDRKVILELDCDLLVGQGFEDGKYELRIKISVVSTER